MTATLLHGDCLEHLRGMDSDSIDALVTDPPYGLSAPPDVSVVLRHWLSGETYEHGRAGFMGRDWDSFVPGPEVWREVWRVMKPGAHGVVFAGTRTVDLMGIALRLAGFEIRDCGQWCYWSGFPKSLDLSKEMDRLAGKLGEREVVGVLRSPASRRAMENAETMGGGWQDAPNVTAPATPEAHQWSGFGTALKPAVEPWILIRKPISESSIARNVLRWGTGGLNIDACRFAPGDSMWPGPCDDSDKSRPGTAYSRGAKGERIYGSGNLADPLDYRRSDDNALGRFPANLIHSPKASRAEREMGCEGLPARTGAEATHRSEGSDGLNSPRAGAGRTAEGIRNHHPTVKPLALMRWLVRLVTPPGGVVLDPFTGSGTTGMAAAGQGFGFVGCELEAEHVQIARARIEYAAAGGIACDLEDVREPVAQVSLW